MAVLDVTKKAAIYHTVSQINTAFAAIVGHYQTLRESGLLTARFTGLYQGFTRELQSEFNQDFLLVLHKLELDDWSRFGKVRQQWEKHLHGPVDPLSGKRRNKRRNKRSKKTGGKKHVAGRV